MCTCPGNRRSRRIPRRGRQWSEKQDQNRLVDRLGVRLGRRRAEYGFDV